MSRVERSWTVRWCKYLSNTPMLFLLWACSGDPPLTRSEDEHGSIARGDAGVDSTADVFGDAAADGEMAITWAPCPALTDGEGQAAECTTVRYPMYRTAAGAPGEDGATLEVFFKRLPTAQAAKGHVWLLAGGPGSPGSSLEPLARQIQKTHPSLEVYLPDHRGAGRSTLFDCLVSRSSFERGELTSNEFIRACSNELVEVWGEDLSFVSVTEAAYDVIAMMEATARPDVPIVAMGGSYGAYWLHRVLQLSGGLISSAVFDGPLRPIGGLSAIDLILEPEQAGMALLDLCSEDPECSERLGEDASGRALEMLDRGATCRGIVGVGLTRVFIQYALSEALERQSLRGLVPAVLYRLNRCEPEDVEFIVAFVEAVLDRPSITDAAPSSAPFSLALARHINWSEVFSEPVTARELTEASNASVFGNAGPTLATFEGDQHWHRYTPDEWVGKWADTSPNVLILQGSLDSVTPPRYARELAEHFSNSNHYYFEIDYAGHIATFTSHEVEEGVTCGMNILNQFLQDPGRAPDGSCATNAPPFTFGADADLLLDWVGHTDAWDNPATTG